MNEEEIKQHILNEITKTEDIISEYRELSKPVAPDDAIGRISCVDCAK